MRILQIHNQYRRPGGEDSVARIEADVLRKAGHDVHELTVTNPEGLVGSVTTMMRSSWNRQSARMVAEAAGAGQFDIAHVYNTWFALSLAVLPALQAVGLKTVFTVQNYRLVCSNGLLLRDGRPCELCVGSHPWHGVVHRCYHGSAVSSAAVALSIERHKRRDTVGRDVDQVLVATQFAREKLVDGGLPADLVTVKPNFVADPGPRPLLPSASTEVLFAGRLSVEKGIVDLIQAWAAAPPPGLTLTIAGDGPLREQLEAMAPSGIRFLGHVPEDELRQVMQTARALVFPSVCYEGQPMVLLQALAAGLPIIGTDIGGVGETLAPLGARWRYLPGDKSALSDRLLLLLDAVALEAAAKRARQAYEQMYSLTVGAAKLERVYESVLVGGSR